MYYSSSIAWTSYFAFYLLVESFRNMLTETRNKHFSERVYYASGVPMVQSWGKDRQPYLYNGKEFVEAHDHNTYDYGFRGYYAPIGRFTSVDPLTEQTPWQFSCGMFMVLAIEIIYQNQTPNNDN